ncbi:ABC transporter permease [Thalassotalea aquiviva]|uniref:ABC transporter permease n=1 Tax=Thalassotalea aquiviva TaxID=3242415 RepID=UPI00352A08D6
MWLVFVKELRELLRDRKTLFFIMALPMVVFPVLFGVVGFIGAKFALDQHQKEIRYVIINEHAAPKFAETVFYHSDFKKLDLTLAGEEQIRAAIQNEEVDLVLVLDPNHQEKIAALEKSHWQVYSNSSSIFEATQAKIDKLLNQYTDNLQKQKLDKINMLEQEYQAFRQPVAYQYIDTADDRESFGEKLGGFIPYILIPLCLTGAMYPAIDLGAGEKERGTIETLLLTPVSRFALVMGKFLCSTTTAIMTALITIFSMVFWSYLIGKVLNFGLVSQVLSSVQWYDYILIVLLLVPVSAIFAASSLAISIYAKSYKEAQNYMGPLTMVVFMPVIVAMLPGSSLTFGWSMVPISNVALAIKELLKGTIDYTYLIVIFGSTGVFALLTIMFCVHWFNKESVLFR